MDKYFSDKIVCEKHAKDIDSEEDDYMMVAFSDNGDAPEQYVILQRAYFFDEQDIELGMDSYYIEYVSPDCEVAEYGMCEEITLNEREVCFKFKSNPDEIGSLRIDISQMDKESIPADFKSVFQEIIGTAP